MSPEDDPYYHEAHYIAQQILTHFSVRLEVPMRVEYKGHELERTFAIDTIVYILNRLFRMHQDELDVAYTKDHKFDGLYKVIGTTGKSQTIIIVEFSYRRKVDVLSTVRAVNKSNNLEIKQA
ncbi:7230_t:CDS:2 [Rhizophagus irregularis]|nr:7230_t:CDS:2 [Rhizophagus irregularis]